MLQLIIVWMLAVLLLADAIYISFNSNFTLGTALVWGAGLALAAYGIFHRHIDAFTRQGFGFVLKIVVLTGAALFTALLVFVAVSGYTHSTKGDEKAIIVLGAGLRGEQVSGVLHRRLDAALAVWRGNPDTFLVVTGGQGSREPIPEAVAMERWLLARGVPAEKIIVEDKSKSTEENLRFAKELLAKKGVSADMPVAVATNAFHCYRAGRYAAREGFADARSIPASISPGAIPPSYMREVFAILYMWVFK